MNPYSLLPIPYTERYKLGYSNRCAILYSGDSVDWEFRYDLLDRLLLRKWKYEDAKRRYPVMTAIGGSIFPLYAPFELQKLMITISQNRWVVKND